MIFEKALFASEDQYVILPPRRLAEGSTFGTSEVLGKCPCAGTLLKIKRQRAYQLSCNHIITDPTDIGGACQVCFLVAVQSDPNAHPADYLICKLCRKRCTEPFCNTGSILCEQHAAEHPSNQKMLCPTHFMMLDENMRLGVNRAKAKRWIQSLFRPEEKCLP